MNILHFIVVAILIAAGYLLHDPLVGEKGVLASLVRPSPDTVVAPVDPVTKTPPVTVEVSPVDVEEPDEKPAGREEEVETYSLSKVIPADFPAVCVMKRSGVGILNGDKFNLDAGKEMEPIALEDDQLEAKLKDLGVTVKVPVKLTNFEELTRPVTEARLNGGRVPTREVVGPKPVAPETTPQPDNPIPDPEMAPKVDPEPEPAPARARMADAEVKQLLKGGYGSLAALKGAQITTVSVGSDETIGQETYQVGQISFKKQTLLGVRQLSVKALIADGKIDKWVWANSGQTVR